MPRRLFHIFALLIALCVASPLAAQDVDDFPGGESAKLEPYVAPRMFRLKGVSIKVALKRPRGWTVTREGDTLLLAPEPNPGDVGVLILFERGPAEGEAPASADSVAPRVDGLVAHAQETHREALQLEDANRRKVAATAVSLQGQFENGDPARFLVVHFERHGAVVTAIGGASDRVYGPYQNLLRDILTSVQVTVWR